MPAPYSQDLRIKALEAVKRGEKKATVSRMLGISRNTVDLWLKRAQATGGCQAITKYQKGCRHKITDWEKFKQFAKENGGKTQGQMAELWGEGVTQQNISDGLERIGLSRKKKRMDIENEMKSNEKNSGRDSRPSYQSR